MEEGSIGELIEAQSTESIVKIYVATASLLSYEKENEVTKQFIEKHIEDLTPEEQRIVLDLYLVCLYPNK